ncbi:MAG: 2-dehydropantoate 2-reductase [Cellvibrionaceae bacterium]
MEHLVFGAGLIGGYLGASLMISGRDVGWVVRPKTQEKLRNGLRVTDYLGNDRRVEDLKFVDVNSADVNEAPAILWLTIKCTALEAAVDDIRAVIGLNSVIISLQNGLGAETYLQRQFPDHKVIRGVMAANVAELASDHLHRGTLGGIDLPLLPETEALNDSFRFEGLSLGLYENLEGLVWAKLQLNLNNPLNALSDIPLKTQLEQRDFRRILAAAMDEYLEVAKRRGVDLPKLTPLPPAWIPSIMRLPNWLFVRIAAKMLAIDPNARSSMWSDLSSGRKSEIDFLNGAVVDEGKKLGVNCPVNQAIRDLIYEVERGRETIGFDSKELRLRLLA